MKILDHSMKKRSIVQHPYEHWRPIIINDFQDYSSLRSIGLEEEIAGNRISLVVALFEVG